jgi:hypothetical protein
MMRGYLFITGTLAFVLFTWLQGDAVIYDTARVVTSAYLIRLTVGGHQADPLEGLAEVRLATTLVEVSRLIAPLMLSEIEVKAIR